MTARSHKSRSPGRDRDHHIATVAHHFLAGDGVPAGRRPGAALLVAAAAALPVTAFVAAGAARSAALAARTRWRLLEDEAAVWSAASHLQADEWVQRLGPGDFDRTRHRHEGLCWHLGGVGPDQLDAWAGAAVLPGCALPTADRPTHLLWCVADEDAGALAGLEPLARLAKLVAPRRVDMVVAPRDWPRRRPAPAAAAGSARRAIDLLGERAADLVGLPVRLGTLTADTSGAAAAAVVTDLVRTPATAAS